MTADEYRAALRDLGLTQVGAARVLGVSARTGRQYAATGPSGPAAIAIKLLLELSIEYRNEWIKRRLA